MRNALAMTLIALAAAAAARAGTLDGVLETDGYKIATDAEPGDLRAVAERLEQVRDALEDTLGSALPRRRGRLPVYVFKVREDYERFTERPGSWGLYAGRAAVGGVPAGAIASSLGVFGTTDDTASVLARYAVMQRLDPSPGEGPGLAALPLWWHVGLSLSFGETGPDGAPPRERLLRAQALLKARRAPTLEQVVGLDASAVAKGPGDALAMCWALVDYLRFRGSDDRRRTKSGSIRVGGRSVRPLKALEGVSKGLIRGDLAEAKPVEIRGLLEGLLGCPLKELDADFEAYLLALEAPPGVRRDGSTVYVDPDLRFTLHRAQSLEPRGYERARLEPNERLRVTVAVRSAPPPSLHLADVLVDGARARLAEFEELRYERRPLLRGETKIHVVGYLGRPNGSEPPLRDLEVGTSRRRYLHAGLAREDRLVELIVETDERWFEMYQLVFQDLFKSIALEASPAPASDAAAPPPTGEPLDRIVLRDGREVMGRAGEVAKGAVEVQVRFGSVVFPADEVSLVEYADGRIWPPRSAPVAAVEAPPATDAGAARRPRGRDGAADLAGAPAGRREPEPPFAVLGSTRDVALLGGVIVLVLIGAALFYGYVTRRRPL